ncbi:serine/threonine-protein kinase [Streptomyces qinglanensis]|uniref:Protein kinase domain-containing protein n=1 Tax=Streptomyces qinglanensis TaxID=943816 RepID=A0A1H9WJK6_9ACTN|nr:serine/threonine-protein kinase [Streptomyces qinglanensis]SES34126.1 Protein kinase domain-containing protein [Streptomyces qinglanensis]
MVQPLAEVDPREIGQYRLLAVLGHGGMGRVYLGAAPDGRLVAVKLIRAALADDWRHQNRFRREVAVALRLRGTRTANVLDADLDAPTPWLASDFVCGPALHRVVTGAVADQAADSAADATTVAVAAGETLPEEAVLRLAAGLIAALEEIHAAGLVHRDLKPDNILLTDEPAVTGVPLADRAEVPADDEGVRVVDFGIALATDDAAGSTRLTRTGWVVGSPSYMSPEQVEGAAITPASDVFSLGSVLVMACTGASPFAGTSLQQVFHDVLYAEPDLSALPDRIRQVAAACLAKDPAERPDLNRLRDLVGHAAASTRPWPPRVAALVRDQRAEVDRLLGPPKDASTTGAEGDGEIDEARWNSRATDPTPFTADALLPERFVNDLDGEYVRVAAGPRPAEEAGPRNLASVLTSCDCPQVMAGVYLEQGSPNPPILVSVTVFPMPDSATASMVYNFVLQYGDTWHKELTLWSAQNHDDGSPRRGDYGDGFFERALMHFSGRYVIAIRTLRTDLLAEDWLYPYVYAATTRASRSCGPENYRKR